MGGTEAECSIGSSLACYTVNQQGAPKGDDKRMGRGQFESDKKQTKSVFQ